MPPTTGYSFGDIVLVPFPFTAVKPVITTIEASLVIRRLGQLGKEEQQALRKAIGQIVG